jgi:twitching motility protein PilU
LIAEQVLEYLKAMNEKQASDLYITVGHPPAVRLETGVVKLAKEPLSADDVRDIVKSVLTTRQKRQFDETFELNTSLDLGKFGRYRINVMQQRQLPALTIRRIVPNIPTFKELGLPDYIGELIMKKRGLILVSGMTGSGKSSTLASMVDYRSKRENGHIVTIEDPIEYYYEHRNSIISQREVGVDTESFAIALKNALRQRPDVIMIGEVRDREVMEQALAASETGHLCISTIHTNNASQAIERVINMFPEDRQMQVRLNLSLNLQAVIAQRLIPDLEGKLTLAIEVMMNQGLVKELIMSGDIPKIRDVMAQNISMGMCTFDQSLLKLFRDGVISEEIAISYADQPGDIKIKIQQIKMGNEDSALKKMDTSVLSISE